MKKIVSIFGGFLFLLSSITNSIAQHSVFMENDLIANAYLGDESTDALFKKLASRASDEPCIKNTYASYYFNNLRNNFCNNAYGTCGFVSIGMLLSFFDSYWNDSFIPDTYDVDSEYLSSRQPSADFDLIPSNSDSPGVRFEPSTLFNNASINEYLEIANSNKDSYFQFKLFDLAKKCFGEMKFDEDNGTLGLNSQEIYEVLSYYIHDYRHFLDNEVTVNLFATSDESQMKTDVVRRIKNGNPVILVVKQPNSTKAHSVVAYDYNSLTGDIYVHTWWRNETMNVALTRASLRDIGYTTIVSETSLDVKIEKNLEARYYSNNGGDDCSSSTFIFPREIKMTSGNFIDKRPTFTWKSLYSEKWEESRNPYINLSILNSNKTVLFQKTKIYALSYTLKTSEWEKIIFETSGEKYYVLLTLNSDTYPYWSDYWCQGEFVKPDLYRNIPYVFPNEYGFADAYPTDSATKTDFESHTERGFTFETRRYRTGYIHEEDIVMSPIRTNINEAFIEYRFKTALLRIDVEMSHWRELSKEWLSNSNGMAVVQQYIDDDWVTALDLLSTDTCLPRDRNNKKLYKIEFSQPAYRIRFYSHYNGSNTSDSNRGRICIGKMAFYESTYNLPLSGSEIDYKPDLWNQCQKSTNCYSYAVNVQINPTTNSFEKMQPGQASGQTIKEEDLLDTDKVLSVIQSDANILGFGFIKINAKDLYPNGMYKVAFVIDNQDLYGDPFGRDYHWYRQNSDGTWSHKPGTTRVRKDDYSNEIIMDPRKCNRDAGNGLNYNLFVGFYAIKPLNIMC